MTFSELFSKSLKDIKKAKLPLWLISSISTLLLIGSYLPSEPYDITEVVNDIQGTDLSSIASMLSGFILFGVVLAGIGVAVFIVSVIYDYYLSCKIIDIIEDTDTPKGVNLSNVILAKFLFTILYFIPVAVALISLVVGIIIKSISLAILMTIVATIISIYISIRYSSLYYVAAKYQDLKITELLRKSSSITKGNGWTIIGNSILISIIAFFITFAFEFAMAFPEALLPVIFVPISVIGGMLISIVITLFTLIFTINMHKSFDDAKKKEHIINEEKNIKEGCIKQSVSEIEDK